VDESLVTVSIVLPSYNEGAALPRSIEKLQDFLGSFHATCEVIVVDDCSDDDTLEIPWERMNEHSRVRYIRHPVRKGKGAALVTGINAATGKYLVYTDADLPVDLHAIACAVNILDSSPFEVVIGNRRHAESMATGKADLGRRVISKIFNGLCRAIATPGFADTQCCLKAFDTDVLRRILPRVTVSGYAIDVEFLYLAKRAGLAIAEIPVAWFDGRASLRIDQLVRMLWKASLEVLIMRLRHGKFGSGG
jgi:dolichyl-phosphate beta-glucosyltransferase